MRLWHYKLIKYLPKQQLLSQWRELNSIYVKQDNHILINYIYEYSDIDLLVYSQLVIEEMNRRGYKCNLNHYKEYFKSKGVLDYDHTIDDIWLFTGLFENHMNKTYLKICCWNLYEKFLRGQPGFTNESVRFIVHEILGIYLN